MPTADIIVEAFSVLRNHFFDKDGNPTLFPLRDKRNTQDDPLDEYISELLAKSLKGCRCTKAPGPLITPDLVLFRQDICEKSTRGDLRSDLPGFIDTNFLKTHPTQWKRTDSDMQATHINLLSPEDKKKGTRVLYGIDSTWPSYWKEEPQRVRFENSYSSPLQEWVTKNWGRLGLPGKALIKKPRMRRY